MTTDIARYDAPTAMPAKVEYAKALADSGLLPKAYQRQPANVLYAVEYGAMLDLSPMAAITGVHIIEGKPSASAGLVSALVRRAGHRLRVTGNDTEATAQIIRSDDPDFVFESRWTLDRARAAGLAGKGVWKSYPAAMLKARAITEVARDACEEALFGLHYTPEELGAAVDGDGAPVVEVIASRPTPDATQPAAPRQAPPPPRVEVDVDSLLEAIADAPDESTLRALWDANAADLTGDGRARVIQMIQAAKDDLAKVAEPVDAELVEQ